MRRLLSLFFLVPVLAGCGNTVTTSTLPASHAASPQQASLGWLESIGDRTGRIVFGVRSFEVTRTGWQARISLTNDTEVPFAYGRNAVPGSFPFGVMLFSTGRHSELERRNSNRSLPDIRAAETLTPALPTELGAHKSWNGTISARGPLAAGTWARIVFGTLFPANVVAGDRQTGKSSPQLPEALRKAHADGGLTWITDHAYELKR